MSIFLLFLKINYVSIYDETGNRGNSTDPRLPHLSRLSHDYGSKLDETGGKNDIEIVDDAMNLFLTIQEKKVDQGDSCLLVVKSIGCQNVVRENSQPETLEP